MSVQNQKKPVRFSKEIGNGFMLGNKLVNDQTKSCGRQERQSLELIKCGQKKVGCRNTLRRYSFRSPWTLAHANKYQKTMQCLSIIQWYDL